MSESLMFVREVDKRFVAMMASDDVDNNIVHVVFATFHCIRRYVSRYPIVCQREIFVSTPQLDMQ
jgi:hypothetical protein